MALRTLLGLSLLCICSMAFGQPKPILGVCGGGYTADYSGFGSTIIRDDLYPSSSYTFEQVLSRPRRTLGMRMLVPVLTFAFLYGEDWIWSPTDTIQGSWRSPSSNGGAKGLGIGLDLDLCLSWNRFHSEKDTYDTWEEADAADDSDYRFTSHQNELQYLIWLNYDYLDFDVVGRIKVWSFLGNKNSWLRLVEPFQFHFDLGYSMGLPLNKNGIYYKSNDATQGIDEQVMDNLNEVIQPAAGLSLITGCGIRLGRFDLVWRNRTGKRDALTTDGNTFNFRERENIFSSRSSEFTLTVYIGGGAKD